MAKKTKPSGTPASGTPATVLLDRAGVWYRAHAYQHDPAVTNFGAEAAELLGVDPARVFKTLLAEVDGSLVVAIVPVLGTLDLKRLASAADGKRAAMADPLLAQRKTGYVVGGISPLGQKTRLPCFLDQSALRSETVFVSGGRRGFDIELAPDDLLTLTQGCSVSLARGGHV